MNKLITVFFTLFLISNQTLAEETIYEKGDLSFKASSAWEVTSDVDFDSDILDKPRSETVIALTIKKALTTGTTNSTLVIEEIRDPNIKPFELLTDRFATLKMLLKGFQATSEPEYSQMEGVEVYKGKGKRMISNLLRNAEFESQDCRFHFYAFKINERLFVIRYVIAREHWNSNIGITDTVRSVIESAKRTK